MEKILLHSCCAPCSAAILEWLQNNDYEPVLFYFNPNIFPEEEYLKRKNELSRFCEDKGITCIDGDWTHNEWLEAVRGYEREPERGQRCQICFDVRLLATAHCAHQHGIHRFTTTLAGSRWKSLDQIHLAGHRAAEQYPDVTYWEMNWRKGGLQERRNQLLKIYDFYNQKWCGCEFSRRDMLLKEKELLLRAQQNNPILVKP